MWRRRILSHHALLLLVENIQETGKYMAKKEQTNKLKFYEITSGISYDWLCSCGFRDMKNKARPFVLPT